MAKHFFKLQGKERIKALAISRGDAPATLLLKNARVLDLVLGETFLTHIALCDEFIAGVGEDYREGEKIIDLQGKYVVPGFIDAHVHIESSLMHPFEFEKRTLKHGTTTVIADPHEITNVLGTDGFSWMLRCAEKMRQTLLVQVPSCVPSIPGIETNGGDFPLEVMASFKHHPHVLGLAEMMNVPGVIFGDEDILAKIDAFEDGPLDGHAPLLRGRDLNAYRLCGIQNCHESVSTEEALEKLRYGMAVMLREGSAAKNLDTMASIITPFNSHQCLLCTDDRNPLDIDEEGHVDHMVRRLIQKHKIPPHVAFRLSSYSTAQHFNLKRVGLIAPGYVGDMVILSDLENVVIDDVYKKGRPVSSIIFDTQNALNASHPPIHNSIHRSEVCAQELELTLDVGVFRVIEVIPGEIITKERHVSFDGTHFERTDILPIQVCERYGKGQPPASGLVCGFGAMRGAMATSIAHDSHNLMVIGKNATDRAFALNRLRQMGGGIVIVEDGIVKGELPLPIAGLISLQSGDVIAEKLRHLRLAAKEIGCTLHEPFLQMAFLSLPVIPELKLTDRGLIRPETMQHVSLRVS